MDSACEKCGSHAINHHLHGRDGSDPHLCDVCYWRNKADIATVVSQQLYQRLKLTEEHCAANHSEPIPEGGE